MSISLRPIDKTNRKAVLKLSVRDDQPFVAPNRYSLKQADETNAEHPGAACTYTARRAFRRPAQSTTVKSS